MGLDAWTRSPIENHYRQREANRTTKPAPPLTDRLKARAEGFKKCACGCGSHKASAFRGGKMYDPKCVGRSSQWAKSGLPQDRTPPSQGDRWSRRREINRNSRELDREQ